MSCISTSPVEVSLHHVLQIIILCLIPTHLSHCLTMFALANITIKALPFASENGVFAREIVFVDARRGKRFGYVATEYVPILRSFVTHSLTYLPSDINSSVPAWTQAKPTFSLALLKRKRMSTPMPPPERRHPTVQLPTSPLSSHFSLPLSPFPHPPPPPQSVTAPARPTSLSCTNSESALVVG